jgi:hypothetical protein
MTSESIANGREVLKELLSRFHPKKNGRRAARKSAGYAAWNLFIQLVEVFMAEWNKLALMIGAWPPEEVAAVTIRTSRTFFGGSSAAKTL